MAVGAPVVNVLASLNIKLPPPATVIVGVPTLVAKFNVDSGPAFPVIVEIRLRLLELLKFSAPIVVSPLRAISELFNAAPLPMVAVASIPFGTPPLHNELVSQSGTRVVTGDPAV